MSRQAGFSRAELVLVSSVECGITGVDLAGELVLRAVK
jgi:hypothetical protein